MYTRVQRSRQLRCQYPHSTPWVCNKMSSLNVLNYIFLSLCIRMLGTFIFIRYKNCCLAVPILFALWLNMAGFYRFFSLYINSFGYGFLHIFIYVNSTNYLFSNNRCITLNRAFLINSIGTRSLS